MNNGGRRSVRVLARGRVRVAAGRTAKVGLRLTAPGHRALRALRALHPRAGMRASLAVAVHDLAGNRRAYRFKVVARR